MPGTVEKNMQHLKNMGKARVVSYIYNYIYIYTVMIVIVYDTTLYSIYIYIYAHTHTSTMLFVRALEFLGVTWHVTLHRMRGSKLLARSGLKLSHGDPDRVR